jgi:hypothetical protein
MLLSWDDGIVLKFINFQQISIQTFLDGFLWDFFPLWRTLRSCDNTVSNNCMVVLLYTDVHVLGLRHALCMNENKMASLWDLSVKFTLLGYSGETTHSLGLSLTKSEVNMMTLSTMLNFVSLRRIRIWIFYHYLRRSEFSFLKRRPENYFED